MSASTPPSPPTRPTPPTPPAQRRPGQVPQGAPATMPQRPPAAGRRAGHGPPWMSMGLPAEKSMNFGPSARRLLRRLMPERLLVGCVIALAIVSVTFSVLGPKILGHATNIVFDGVLGKRLPSGVTLQQAVDA